jgi:hypothetical protein
VASKGIEAKFTPKKPRMKEINKIYPKMGGRKNKKDWLTATPHDFTHPTTEVVQYRHPKVRTSLQNCFPQELSSLLKAAQANQWLPD